LYERVGFAFVFPEDQFVDLSVNHGIPSHVMSLRPQQPYLEWRSSQPELFDYFFNTYHPDIEAIGLERHEPTAQAEADRLIAQLILGSSPKDRVLS
jgi:hypothetical protein